MNLTRSPTNRKRSSIIGQFDRLASLCGWLRVQSTPAICEPQHFSIALHAIANRMLRSASDVGAEQMYDVH